jgi:hypothetical protein
MVFITQDLTEIFLNKETIEPIDDADINDFNRDDNSGASNYLHVGKQLLGRFESYMKFKIPSKPKSIMKATIKTYWYSIMCDSWLTVKACVVSNHWNEKNLTWNDAPSHGLEITSEEITDGTEFNIDITDYINGSGDFSICIFEQSPYCTHGLQSASDEGERSNSPRLVVQYQGISMELTLFIFSFLLIILGFAILVKYVSLDKKSLYTK